MSERAVYNRQPVRATSHGPRVTKKKTNPISLQLCHFREGGNPRTRYPSRFTRYENPKRTQSQPKTLKVISTEAEKSAKEPRPEAVSTNNQSSIIHNQLKGPIHHHDIRYTTYDIRSKNKANFTPSAQNNRGCGPGAWTLE
jgi:hypothetical protein